VTGGPREARPLLTWADRLVLYALVGAGVVLLAAAHGGGTPPAGGTARISAAGGWSRVVRLDENARYEVPGPLGASVVEVRGCAVRMASSPCPGHVCERMGPARRPGESIVCVPNEVVVVVGGDAGATDATTR
jgi:hypothetical protein